jgi:hypothetical protein
MSGEVIRMKIRVGEGALLEVRGRAAWALDQLIKAGDQGCTPIEQPGPRWSDYVFKLRRKGIVVQTIDEKHGGPYAGEHARYRLASEVDVISAEMKP